jgi:2,3,4,5-tetrahydropyridine-2,6-dicarboxylate N-succinyltransferase
VDYLQDIIEKAYEQRNQLTPTSVSSTYQEAILKTIALLNTGEIRVANKQQQQWVVNQWVKKAVLLYFCITQKQLSSGGFTEFYDKVPLKYANAPETDLHEGGVRIVPPACARYGAYIAPNTVLMPSYINIGAYVDSGTLIDTWATIGSCAQIGKNVHISGGTGIAGVLEPLQANPTIIEDNCFIGARSEIAEGVIVEQGAVISMGVYIGQSTRIYDRQTKKVTYGRIPAGAVVVPGNLPASDGSHSLYCAVIVKYVDEQTRKKVGINHLLRNLD